MAKQPSQRRYLSYLLRLWQTSDGNKYVWRASLESPGSGERRGFTGLKALCDFLKAQVESRDERDHDQGGDAATDF
jgi:hypothetical protein